MGDGKAEQNVLDWPVKNTRKTTRVRQNPPTPHAADVTDIARHFQERYPAMLDGTLLHTNNKGKLLGPPKQTPRNEWTDPSLLPATVLRETLESLTPQPNPTTKAGITAIGPRHARIWWDKTTIDNLDDVLMRLDKPHPILRFYDVTNLPPKSDKWLHTFDIDVELEEKGRTVPFWSSGRTYVVDLGYVHADGRFLRLARTTTAELPRDAAADPDTEKPKTTRCLPLPHTDLRAARLHPDTAAKEWAANREDNETRDIETELIIHMLYRAFLEEGPRALRRAPALARRDADALRREFLRRGRSRPTTQNKAPAFLVARLDAAPRTTSRPTTPLPCLPARRTTGIAALSAHPADERFNWFAGIVAAARNGQPKATATRVAAEDWATFPAVPGFVPGWPSPAKPVFEAAEHLRASLAGMRPLDLLRSRGGRVPREGRGGKAAFGGAGAGRIAPAGTRFPRMAVTLKGRMRPGTGLKIAGRLVHADAEGNFRLECVLPGRWAGAQTRQ